MSIPNENINSRGEQTEHKHVSRLGGADVDEPKGTWLDELEGDLTKQVTSDQLAGGRAEKQTPNGPADQHDPLGENAPWYTKVGGRPNLEFVWMKTHLCMYLNACEVSVSWGEGAQPRDR